MTRVRPLTKADQPAVGELLVQAFPDKMRRILGVDPARGAAVVAAITPPSPNHFVADVDGRVAGVIQFQDRDVPSPDDTAYWRVSRQHLSFLEALRAAFMLAIMGLGDSFPRDRLYIDTVAVHLDCQSQGVASALLRFAIAEGRRRGKVALSLHVVDRNHHARAVYEHLGFRVVHTQRTWFLAPVLGFRSAHYMELPLASL